MMPMSMARSCSSTVVKSQGECAVLGVFLPVDNALYSIAFGSHTKTAEPIEMPFGMMTWVGRRYHVLDDGTRSPKGKGEFLGNVVAHCKVMGHSFLHSSP